MGSLLIGNCTRRDLSVDYDRFHLYSVSEVVKAAVSPPSHLGILDICSHTLGVRVSSRGLDSLSRMLLKEGVLYFTLLTGKHRKRSLTRCFVPMSSYLCGQQQIYSIFSYI